MKRLLIVVDYQNDFVDGALGFEKAKSLDTGIAAKVQEFIGNGDLVLFTFDTHYRNYLQTQEGKNLPVVHCIEHSDGWKLYGETGKLSDSIVELDNVLHINKETFGSDTLINILQGYCAEDGCYAFMNQYAFEDLEEIHLCGVVTNMCVISNAVIAKAALPEAKIVIHADLCASFNDELHEKALDVMESMQMDVINRR